MEVWQLWEVVLGLGLGLEGRGAGGLRMVRAGVE